MKSQIYTYFVTLAVLIISAIALVIAFGMPMTASAACSATPCVDTYDNPQVRYDPYYSGIRNVQYPIPQYVYFQNPAANYQNSLNYRPVVYPIPMYVQTGQNPSTTNYGYNTQYPSLNYVSNSPTSGTPVNGNYSYPTTSYNQPNNYGNGYNNYGTGYGTGFTMTGGSQANNYGASTGGFINTSGR